MVARRATEAEEGMRGVTVRGATVAVATWVEGPALRCWACWTLAEKSPGRRCGTRDTTTACAVGV